MNKMSKHTPGRWRYWPDGNAVVVSQAHVLRMVADFGKVDLVEREANAHLIAAAPELLETVEWMLEVVEAPHYKCDIENDKKCYAEQYGDGNKTEHFRIRECRKLLDKINT